MHHGSVTAHIDAPPEAVWALLADLPRMGEWSPETYRAEWLDGATSAVAGARFRGWNRRGPLRYPTTCEIETAEPGRELAFAVVVRGRRITRWRYRLSPSGGGTDVEESFEQLLAEGPFERITFSPRRVTAMHQGMRATLANLKSAAEKRST